MNAYTISRLAKDAGVSVHVIRDYELRGLLCPCRFTANGYRIYDEQTLQRLQFILAGKAAGVSLNALTVLCQAMDNMDIKPAEKALMSIEETLDQKQQAIRNFRRELNCCIDSEDRKKVAGQG